LCTSFVLRHYSTGISESIEGILNKKASGFIPEAFNINGQSPEPGKTGTTTARVRNELCAVTRRLEILPFTAGSGSSRANGDDDRQGS